ncbi:hypothetical protein [Natrononativus amylolyticus]|uniref:hypothetical protein n=1 Tax=Natrononativus amylolyticus TaxID=2963434 RepID=UPI0020CDF14F|nr:hypothetical protein [Natrononativus amylolyticus]
MDDEPVSFAASFDDPRITDQFCRRVVDDGAVTLLGVVHDHPASIARVELVLEAASPDVLALELPPAAIPLYRMYARDPSPAPRFGGEMAAAIRAADGVDLRGIDAPSWSFLRQLVHRLVGERVAPSTARRVLSSVGSATRTAVTCRLAATLTHATSMTVAYDDPIEYDCDHTDSPERQAAHEQAHVAGVQALLGGADASAVAYRDETRERCMIDRLEAARRQGSVVAVVGVDHLEAIETALSS